MKKLYWRQHYIADVQVDQSDFPGFCGFYHLNTDVPDAVREYIDFCIRTAPQTDEGDFSEEYYAEEERFRYLIDSEQWWLMAEDGEKEAILIPIFGREQQIDWRLDLDRE